MLTKSTFSACLAIAVLAGCTPEASNTFTATGVVEGTSVKVAAQTPGQIVRMNFEEGEDIDVGQTIAVVDTEKLSYQMEQVEASLEEVGVQRQIALNTLTKAQSDFDNIEKKYLRFQDLFRKNSTSQQTLDDLKTAYDAATAQLRNAQQNMKLVESKQKAIEAQRKLLRRQLNDAVVTSPVSGTLTTKFYEQGETVPPGFAVAEVIDLNKMWTKIYVSERMLPKVNVNDEAEVRIDGTEQALPGRVAWISTKAEFTPKNILTEESRTSLVYAVKVNVDNPERILKHGMPVVVVLNL